MSKITNKKVKLIAKPEIKPRKTVESGINAIKLLLNGEKKKETTTSKCENLWILAEIISRVRKGPVKPIGQSSGNPGVIENTSLLKFSNLYTNNATDSTATRPNAMCIIPVMANLGESKNGNPVLFGNAGSNLNSKTYLPAIANRKIIVTRILYLEKAKRSTESKCFNEIASIMRSKIDGNNNRIQSNKKCSRGSKAE